MTSLALTVAALLLCLALISFVGMSLVLAVGKSVLTDDGLRLLIVGMASVQGVVIGWSWATADAAQVIIQLSPRSASVAVIAAVAMTVTGILVAGSRYATRYSVPLSIASAFLGCITAQAALR
jgi:hypothetical protein